MTKDLLPCPFCKGIDLRVFGEMTPDAWVECLDCGAEGPHPQHGPNMAIDLWNKASRALEPFAFDIREENRKLCQKEGHVLGVIARPCLRCHEWFDPQSSPADLVGALQDVVHKDTGPVRAAHAVKSGESQ